MRIIVGFLRYPIFKWFFALPSLLLVGVASGEALRVGFGTHKPPYVYEDTQSGLEVDIIVRAAKLADMEVKPMFAPMERLHNMLKHGDIDAIATTNPSSGVPAFFSAPYITYNNVAAALSVRKLSVLRISDLTPFSVSAFQRARFLLGAEFSAMVEANPQYREEAQQITRNRLLHRGRVDLIVGDKRIIEYFNRELKEAMDVTQPVTYFHIFPPTLYNVAFLLAAQRDRFDKGLSLLRSSGDYARIQKQYDGVDNPQTPQ